jgi:hypothetical protein
MTRARQVVGRAVAVLGALVCVTAAACDERGKTAPERCADPPLPLFDIRTTPPPEDDNRRFNDGGAGDGAALPPCITEVGHAVSSFTDGSAGEPFVSAGSSSIGGSGNGGLGGGGAGNGGEAADAGSPGAGAGGA